MQFPLVVPPNGLFKVDLFYQSWGSREKHVLQRMLPDIDLPVFNLIDSAFQCGKSFLCESYHYRFNKAVSMKLTNFQIIGFLTFHNEQCPSIRLKRVKKSITLTSGMLGTVSHGKVTEFATVNTSLSGNGKNYNLGLCQIWCAFLKF